MHFESEWLESGFKVSVTIDKDCFLVREVATSFRERHGIFAL